MKQRAFLNLCDVFQSVSAGKDRHALRNFNFMNKHQPASVGQLAYDLGFEVRHEKLPHAVSAFLEPDTWSEKGFEIVVNAGHSKVRQRFSALHEIAHYYLHTPQDDFLGEPKHRAQIDVGFDKIYSQEEIFEEFEANSWADAVIFGEQALEGAVGMLGKNITLLSRHFGFSDAVVRKAMIRRRII